MTTKRTTPTDHKVLRVIATDGTVSASNKKIVFADVAPNNSLLTQYVRSFLVNQRQGTASTKDRSQIRGTTKKVYKQKGTGNARHGSQKAPIYVGGGVVGGPQPKDYNLKMSKQQKIIALQSAIARHTAAGSIVELASEISTLAKTKEVVTLLKKSGMSLRSMAVVVDTQKDVALMKSLRNVAGVTVIALEEINPYIILKSHSLVFSAPAYQSFVKRFDK